MSAGMAGVIAAHAGYDTHWEDRDGVQVWYTVCDGCDWRHDVVGRDAPADTHAAHVAEELTKAGYGLVDPLAAALADPEGHALVKAIHDRKANDRGR